MLKNITLMLIALFFTFLCIEIGYRIIDPYPYFPPREINHTMHGNTSQYDQILGWRGIPNAGEYHVTENARVLVQHNRFGFRDIAPDPRSPGKPAIVFLGDSFTWGFEVEFNEMFVNIMRQTISKYEVYNLGHKAYGTDQALLTFNSWAEQSPLHLVILMFQQTDVLDNISRIRYRKPKPVFELDRDRLVLKNVPVPLDDGWKIPRTVRKIISFRKQIKYLAFQSHFVHDVYFRLFDSNRRWWRLRKYFDNGKTPDMKMTRHIIEKLRNEVNRRGGEVLVIAIPPKEQFIIDEYIPYQQLLEEICKDVKVEYFDLTPYFESALFRTFYRHGIHWNRYGNKVAAEAIYEYLRKTDRI